jgi:hypothetical protein
MDVTLYIPWLRNDDRLPRWLEALSQVFKDCFHEEPIPGSLLLTKLDAE